MKLKDMKALSVDLGALSDALNGACLDKEAAIEMYAMLGYIDHLIEDVVAHLEGSEDVTKADALKNANKIMETSSQDSCPKAIEWYKNQGLCGYDT